MSTCTSICPKTYQKKARKDARIRYQIERQTTRGSGSLQGTWFMCCRVWDRSQSNRMSKVHMSFQIITVAISFFDVCTKSRSVPSWLLHSGARGRSMQPFRIKRRKRGLSHCILELWVMSPNPVAWAMPDEEREALALPDAASGQPVSYGPQATTDGALVMQGPGGRTVEVSPFWSQAAREEALLRSMRPEHLPAQEDEAPSGFDGRTGSGTEAWAGQQPPQLQELLRAMIVQNNQLRHDIFELRGEVRERQRETAELREEAQLRQRETAELREAVQSRQRETPRPSVEEVGGSQGAGTEVVARPAVEETRVSTDPAAQVPLALEDGNVGRVAVENVPSDRWNTPPNSLPNSTPPTVTGQGITGQVVEPQIQQEALGQVRDTLSNLVAQLAAATGQTRAGHGPQPAVQGGYDSGQGGCNGFSGGPRRDLHPSTPDRNHPLGGQTHGHFGGASHYGGLPSPGQTFNMMNDGWLNGLSESIRTVDLPPIPSVKEGELGGTVIGDWLALINPIMRDLSISSGQWWESVLSSASSAYQQWLHSDPVQRLHIQPQLPAQCTTTWSRLEQRGQSMLLTALPEGLRAEVLSSRMTSTVHVLYKMYTRYQPGGLGERALLLRQLVEGGKQPTSVIEMLDQLRSWKRALKRADELKVVTPDPTLLIGALDKMSSLVMKSSAQATFRLNTTRAALMVDVSPTLGGVMTYADSVLAEAEGMHYGGMQLSGSTVKVKAMDGPATEKSQNSAGTERKGEGKGKTGEKGSKDRPACKFFGTEDGCKKGADCTYAHDWNSIDSKGRCWTCSSTKHTKRDCTVKAMSSSDTGGKGKKGGEKAEKAKSQEGTSSSAAPTLKKAEPETTATGAAADVIPGRATDGHPRVEGDLVHGSQRQPAQELLEEAASLLKSLRGPALRAIKVSSLEVKDQGKTLLDGGATHALRTAKSQEEWDSAQEVRVELAQGTATLRQLPWSRTLLSLTPVQSIVPLGVLAEIGYAIRWEGTYFELTDPSGCILDTTLENGCPTVVEALGLELIKEVERNFVEKRARLAVLRGEGNPGELEIEEVKRLEEIRQMFPELPEEIAVRILPSSGWHGEDLPWNRRIRRRLRKASQVVIHLFSGKNSGFWQKELSGNGREVLCVDTELDRRQNVLNDGVYSYLLMLSDGGTVQAILGGPPCRTMSRLRYRQPGPPPLRTRLGANRFGFDGLDPQLQQRVEDDTVLWLRQYYLFHRAKKANPGKKVLYLKEQPEDPEHYLSPAEVQKQRYPSYWAFPEWETMKKLDDLVEVNFDQGPFGHSRRKPTTLGTNIYELEDLNETRGPGSTKEGYHEEKSIEERIQLSRQWAEWSPGLCKAISTAIKRELDGGMVAKMSLADWKKHLEDDHFPYNKNCKTCLIAAAQGRQHRRIVTPDSFTLSVDLAGPFKQGDDQLGKGKYLLIGTYTVPTNQKGIRIGVHIPDDQGDGDLEEDALKEVEEFQTEEEEVDPRLQSAEDQKEDDSAKWLAQIKEEEDFLVKQITMVEVLPDRKGPNLISGIARFYARLRYLQLPVMRLHSDRAGELRSKLLRKWCEDRGIYRTYTDADSFKSNGRAEAEIKTIRRMIRAVMLATGTEEKLWPLIARHVGERRTRYHLQNMGYEVRKLLPFGSTAYAKQKIWDEKYENWKMMRRKVKILGPDVMMSASMPGYYVQDEDGRYLHSSDLRQGEEPPEEAAIQDADLGEIIDDPHRMRMRGKQPPGMRRLEVSMEEAEERRMRGLKLIMEELDIEDEKSDASEEVSPFVRALIKENEELAAGIIEERKKKDQEELEQLQQAAEAQDVVLQTRTYALNEVKAELDLWVDSMKSEFKSLTEETGAIKVITEREAEALRKEADQKGILFEKIPAKAVFTRKAGSGKRKCRACACGNYMSQRSAADTYAGGTGASEVRVVMRLCGMKEWDMVTLDVKTAFLRAPKDHTKETIIVQPPQVFILAGICAPGTLWWVDRALYGLTTSPREWTDHRNERLKNFRWTKNGRMFMVKATADQDIWSIHEVVKGEETSGTAVGYFVTYVDDMMAVGEHSVLEGFCDRVQQEWEVGTPDWLKEGSSPIRFLGMEIEKKDGKLRVHQQSYILNLLSKYEDEKGVGLGAIKIPDEEPEVSAADVQTAQRQTGELLWLTGRTRPDLSYPISIMCQYAARRPKGVQAIGREVRAYLRTSLDLALEYAPLEDGDFGEAGSQRRARHEGSVEVYTDASFASNNLKSMSGVVAFFAGAPVFWITSRQSFTTLSTAESELMSMMEGLTSLRFVKSVVEMFVPNVEGRMYSDSTAGISIVSGTTGSWRTRHLRIRAQGLHEALERGETTLEHQSGKLLVADGMTKQLQGALLRHFIQALKMVSTSGGSNRSRASVWGEISWRDFKTV